MATLKVCFVIATLATGGFGTLTRVVSNSQPQDAEVNARLFAMLFVSATIPSR